VVLDPLWLSKSLVEEGSLKLVLGSQFAFERSRTTNKSYERNGSVMSYLLMLGALFMFMIAE
jgi:hypothetical protein